MLNNGKILDHHLPSFFQTTYPGQGATTETAIQSRWENDHYYLRSLLRERLEYNVKEINELVASHYGHGPVRQYFNIGYIKGKAQGYEDLNRAASAIRDAFLFASHKVSYVTNDSFTSKYEYATGILQRLLREANGHQTDRIYEQVKGVIGYNLALAAFLAHEFEQAEAYLNLTSGSGRNTHHETSILRERINDSRKRFLSNGTLESRSGVEGSQSVLSAENPTNYIVDHNNDTVSVEFIMPSGDAMIFGDSLWLQEKITIVGETMPVEIFPDQIKGFCYKGFSYEALWWVEETQTTPWRIVRKFCKRIVTGAVPVFSCNIVTTDQGGYQTVRSNLYYKEDDQYKPASFFNFNRGVSRLISKHSDLARQVRDGTYDRDQFITILRQYNSYLEPKVSH